MGESRDGQKQKFLPIIRSGDGRFFGFGEPELPGHDEMKGRFAQLLPTKFRDDGMGDLAKVMLRLKASGAPALAQPCTCPAPAAEAGC